VLPIHQDLDRSRELDTAARRIGTTQRGIGPAYEDKHARRGVRIADLRRPEWVAEELPRLLAAASLPEPVCRDFAASCRRFVETLGHAFTDCSALLRQLDRASQRLLFEGAQGSLLDVDFGTYPYVTASNSTFLGVGPGTGFSARRIDHVLGVTKAYATRVGEGPFPSEISGDAAESLRQAGNEYGATTGRPRRCGWLDLVALEYAVAINDLDSIAITKFDVLTGRKSIPVVTRYRLANRYCDVFPAHVRELELVEPEYEEWPGWTAPTLSQLRPFVERLERRMGVPVTMLSCGRRRSEIEVLDPIASYLNNRT
jgi:adenylosuccinate synthase